MALLASELLPLIAHGQLSISETGRKSWPIWDIMIKFCICIDIDKI